LVLRGISIQHAARHQRIFGSITICHEWWRIHLATVHLSPLTFGKELFSELQHLARYFPPNMLWSMTLAPKNEAISREIMQKKPILGKNSNDFGRSY
jgi:hypothetical protein